MPPGYNQTRTRYKNAIEVEGNNVYVGFRLIGVGKYDLSNSNWTMFDTVNCAIPSNYISALAIDNGSVWIGTNKGLAKYDGVNWTVYDSLNNGLASNNITCLKKSPAGLWCGTRYGISLFNGTTFINYTTANSLLLNDTINCFELDSANALLIGTRRGLSKFDGATWTNYTPANSNAPLNILQVKYISSATTWLYNGRLVKLSNTPVNLSSCIYYTPTLEHLVNDRGPIEKLSDNKIYSFVDGYTIIRTNENDSAEVFTDSTSTVLFPNPLSMATDANDIIWMTGDFNGIGFMRFDKNAISGYLPIDYNAYSWQRYLDINNVSALIWNQGSMFWNGNVTAGTAMYEVPKCSGKTSIFTAALWLGGYDSGGTLHVSAQTYNQNSKYDFVPGPLDTTNATTSPATIAAFNNIWKIDRNTIDDFKTNFLNGNVSNGSYPVPYELLSYPAIGTGNYTRNMSPYVDYNTDGNYNPYDGDYPLIKGDQQLYWIFNDVDTAQRESGGIPLGVEVRASAYAYTCGQYALGDSNAVIDYTTFYKYEITNRSTNMYDSVFVGLFNDFDLGDAFDDYGGCDTVLNAAFVYNSDNDDGTAVGYYNNPPMMNCQVLQGPEPVLNDGIDNDHDGTTDKAGEKNMMSSFLKYNNDFTNYGNPVGADDYYFYLTSRFKDGSPVTYGGTGYGGTVPTNYFYSGVPYSGTGWTEQSAGNPGNDLRAVVSSGPFHLAPGETKSIDFAYVFTWDSTAANGLTTSIARNTADLQRVKYWFDNNNYPSCLNTSVQNIATENTDVTIFPNPADDLLNIIFSGNTIALLEIYDITGRYITSKEIKSHDKINIHSLAPGLYVAKLKLNEGAVSKKFIRK